MNKQIAAARTKLHTSVISDVLNSFGNMQHAMLPNVRPLSDDSVIFGRARTGLYSRCIMPILAKIPMRWNSL